MPCPTCCPRAPRACGGGVAQAWGYAADVRGAQRRHRRGRVPLFVKKNGDEGMEFYFLGDSFPLLSSIAPTTMDDGAGGKVAVVHMDLALDQPVAESLYRHLVS